MEEFPCSIRIFKIKQMTTAEKTETYWIEAVWEGKKSLFRICHYSKRGHFLFPEGTSSPNQVLIDCILRRLFEKGIISEGGRLVWIGNIKES